MKNLLLILISLICILTTACVGSRDSVKDEAENFNNLYAVELLNIQQEIIANPSLKDFNKTDYKTNLFNFKQRLNSLKIKHKEVQDLKDLLLKQVDLDLVCLKMLERNLTIVETTAYRDQVLRATFDYINKYSIITRGKPIPVINTTSGQRYAYENSDLLFSLFDIDYGEYGNFLPTKPHGKLIELFIYVLNNRKSFIDISAENFKLIDKDGREYSPIVVEPSDTYNYDRLNPKMQTTIDVVIDVPKNTKILDYKLQFSDKNNKILIPINLIRMKTGY